KDMAWDKAGDGWKSHVVPAGEGIVRWKDVGAAVKDVKFNGTISLHGEYETKDLNERKRLAKAELELLKKLLGGAGPPSARSASEGGSCPRLRFGLVRFVRPPSRRRRFLTGRSPVRGGVLDDAVDLGADQQGQGGDIQPQQHQDHAGQGPVGGAAEAEAQVQAE